jgi:outer membrane immunogenic protein
MNYKTVWGIAGIALATATGFSFTAQAADLGERHHASYKDEPVYSAPTNWGGAYVGGHLGAVWTSGDASIQEADGDWRGPLATGDLGETAVFGGVHAGYNWQHASFVYGVEGDVGFSSHIDYLSSIRGRLGVASGNALFYGAGGVAFVGTNLSASISNTFNTATFDLSEHQTGYVVGGGAEFKLNPRWSVGVEGLYYGFDGVTSNVNAANTAGYVGTANAGADFAVVQGRLSYHLGQGYTPLK